MADELVVMCSGAFVGVLHDVLATFEGVPGLAIRVIAGSSVGTTSRAIPLRLRGGEAADLVIVFDEVVDRLMEEGLVAHGSKTPLATSAIGVAVRSGAPKPEIGSADAVRSALLAAASFAYSSSASGVYVASELLSKLDLPPEIGRRGLRVVGEPVGAAIARGAAELGFQQMSELLPIDGIDVLGPLPADIQQISVLSAGVPTLARPAAGATALVSHLRSGASRAALIGAGLGTAVGS